MFLSELVFVYLEPSNNGRYIQDEHAEASLEKLRQIFHRLCLNLPSR